MRPAVVGSRRCVDTAVGSPGCFPACRLLPNHRSATLISSYAPLYCRLISLLFLATCSLSSLCAKERRCWSLPTPYTDERNPFSVAQVVITLSSDMARPVLHPVRKPYNFTSQSLACRARTGPPRPAVQLGYKSTHNLTLPYPSLVSRLMLWCISFILCVFRRFHVPVALAPAIHAPSTFPTSIHSLTCFFPLLHPFSDIHGWGLSPRGAGFLFGGDAVRTFCRTNDIDLIARAHQLAMEGFKHLFDR